MKECSGCDEHRVFNGSVESLNCTPETNVTLYLTNENLNKNLEKIRKNNSNKEHK